jgi:hypothetical protein
MIAARGDFFDAGHYAPLADGVAERSRAALPVGPDRARRDPYPHDHLGLPGTGGLRTSDIYP